jgi:hypothetical protein
MVAEVTGPKTPKEWLAEWTQHIVALKGEDRLRIQIECEAAAESLLADIAGGKLPGRRTATDIAKAADLAGLPDAAEIVFPLFGLDPPKGAQRKLRALGAPVGADEFERSEIGQILKSERNVLLALRKAGVAMRYDEFADRYLITGLDGYGPTLSDHALDELYLVVQRDYLFKPSKDDFDRIVLAAARRKRFHPVRDYLDGLEWDGIERLDEWLTAYGGADDDAFTRAVGRIVLIAAVRRIRDPGCKFDEMLVIEGEQGTLKSSAIAALCPVPDWFSDSLSLSVEERIIIEQTAGKWIIEIGELSGFRKREVEHIKAFLSRRIDSARLAYGRLRIDRARQLVLIGTTNETNYLIDDTGDRRFWPVRIKTFDVARIIENRDQLWAEAAHWEAEGESIRLPVELWPDAAERQAERKEEDEWTQIIGSWLDSEERDPRSLFSHDYNGFRITLAEAAKGALGIERDKLEPATQKRLARCLKAAGWVMAQKSHGKRFWRRAGVE